MTFKSQNKILKPKILIIVPTLNSYKILQKLIDSLHNQTYKEWRLIFVDGKSDINHKKWLMQKCKNDKFLNYMQQDKKSKGIYGAMNDGFKKACKDEWIFFWGSDDWAYSNKSFENLSKVIVQETKMNKTPSIIISKAIYINKKGNKHKRISEFNNKKRINNTFSTRRFRKSLFWGSVPPHQGALIGPEAHKSLKCYSDQYQLASDLDYFLKISQINTLKIKVLDEIIVCLSEGGISGKENFKRFKEVIYLYFKYFNKFWFIPFFSRYIKRLISLIKKK